LFEDYPSADDVITFSKNAVVRHYTGKKHKFPYWQEAQVPMSHL